MKEELNDVSLFTKEVTALRAGQASSSMRILCRRFE